VIASALAALGGSPDRELPASGSTLRASVLDDTQTDVGGPVRVLVDGSDTPVTANGLSDYVPTPGDRLLLQRVGSQVEVIQFVSRGTVPYSVDADIQAVADYAVGVAGDLADFKLATGSDLETKQAGASLLDALSHVYRLDPETGELSPAEPAIRQNELIVGVGDPDADGSQNVGVFPVGDTGLAVLEAGDPASAALALGLPSGETLGDVAYSAPSSSPPATAFYQTLLALANQGDVPIAIPGPTGPGTKVLHGQVTLPGIGATAVTGHTVHPGKHADVTLTGQAGLTVSGVRHQAGTANVTRAGVGAISTTATVTTHSSGGFVAPLMGVNKDLTSREYTTWDAVRIYALSDLASTQTAPAFGAKIVGVTASATYQRSGFTRVQNIAAHVDAYSTWLNDYYGKTGAPSKHANVRCVLAIGNEVDLDNYSAAEHKAHANAYKALQAVTDQYDNAMTGIDIVISQLQDNGADVTGSSSWAYLDARTDANEPLYQFLDVICGSYYPPGRHDYPAMVASSYTSAHRPLPSAPKDIVDYFVSAALATGVTKMAIWEMGMPVLDNPPAYSSNEGNVAQNWATRPQYLEDFIVYWMGQADLHGLETLMATYWSSQKGTPKGGAGNTNPDNRFETDATHSPSGATKWRNAPTHYAG
jgi:hypothetical protein